MNLHSMMQQGVCGLPWTSVDIDIRRKLIQPCCKYSDWYPVENTLEDYWYGHRATKLRNDWKTGTHHKNCYKCDVPDEDFSYKNFKNRLLLNSPVVSKINVDMPKLPYAFKIITGNICNLACRMCDTDSSSKMLNLINKSPWLSSKYNTDLQKRDDDLSWLDGYFKNAKSITFLGGEPFYDSIICDLIYRIRNESAHRDITIYTSTNMMQLEPNFLQVIDELGLNFNFNVSIDGPEHVNNYVRHLGDLSTVIDNSIELLSKRNASMNVNITINALNVGYVFETIEVVDRWNNRLYNETGKKINAIMSSPVHEPKHLHPGVLPADVKSFYIDKFNSHALSTTIQGASEYLNSCRSMLLEDKSELTDDFKTFVKEYDAVTNTDYRKVYPEFNLF